MLFYGIIDEFGLTICEYGLDLIVGYTYYTANEVSRIANVFCVVFRTTVWKAYGGLLKFLQVHFGMVYASIMSKEFKSRSNVDPL